MALQFERPAEAVAAITWLVCSADDVGSRRERDHIYNETQSGSVFQGMSSHEFTSLLGSTRTKLFSTLDNDGVCLAAPAVDEVIDAAKTVLTDDQQVEAFKMASSLAKSDGIVKVELDLLAKLRSRFSISFDQLDE